MYFIIINVLFILFFSFLLYLGIRLKLWAYIPANTLGIIIALTSILFHYEFLGGLDKLKITVLGSAIVIIFIINLAITARDLRKFDDSDDSREVHYLTNPYTFEHFKIIADERMMKSELDKQYHQALNDRLQSLEAWKQGNRAYHRKQYQEAIEKYDNSNNWINTNVANVNQSGVLIRMKQYENAIPFIEQAISLDSNCFEAYMNYGVAAVNLKRFDDALEKFEQAVASKPDNYEAWYCCGNIQLRQKEYRKAIDCYKQSIRYNNEYPEGWFNKGIALKHVGEDEQAMKCFEQVIKISPGHYQAHYRLGNLLNEMDFNDEAIASYNRSVKINPDFVEAWNNRGIVLRKIGKLKEAVKSYNRAIRCNPKYHEAWINRGLAQDSLGKYKLALMSYQRFLEHAPTEKEKYIKITRKRIVEIQDKFNVKQNPPRKQAPEQIQHQESTPVSEENTTEVS